MQNNHSDTPAVWTNKQQNVDFFYPKTPKVPNITGILKGKSEESSCTPQQECTHVFWVQSTRRCSFLQCVDGDQIFTDYRQRRGVKREGLHHVIKKSELIRNHFIKPDAPRRLVNLLIESDSSQSKRKVSDLISAESTACGRIQNCHSKTSVSRN